MTIYPTVLYIKQHSVTGLKYFGKTTAKDPYKYNGSGADWTDHIKKHGRKHVITIRIFGPFTDSIAISKFALAFSRDNNIVESELWANQKSENGLDGNPKGSTHSDASKKKMSDAKKGKPSPLKGIPNGKTASTETKKKRSDAGKGRIFSTETRQRISDARKGKPSPNKGKPGNPHSDETIQKMSDAKKGKPNGRKGKPHSDASKKKMSDAKKGKPNGKKGKTSGKQQNPAPEVECPHCGLVGRGGGMARHHFDNCKMKPL